MRRSGKKFAMFSKTSKDGKDSTKMKTLPS